jgi:hypothetical protein
MTRRPARTLLVAALAAAALAGCSSNAGPPPSSQTTSTVTPTTGSLPATSAGRRRLALTEAHRLVALLRLPGGSRYVVEEPAGDRRLLAEPPSTVAQSDSVTAHRFALVPGAAPQVRNWVAAHRPAGSRLDGTGTGMSGKYRPPVDDSWQVTFSWPAVDQVLNLREMTVETVRLPGRDRTGLRVDVQVGWLRPRPADDSVAPGAGYLKADLGAEMNPGEPGAAHTATADRSVIGAIIRRINGASVLPEGSPHSCPADVGGVLTLQFSKTRTSPAYATVRASATGCQTIEVIRHGKAVQPVLDGSGFVAYVEKVLDMHPTPIFGSPGTSAGNLTGS